MSEGLGLGSFTAMAQIQSLIGELRSYKPHGKKKKKGHLVSHTLIPKVGQFQGPLI